MIKAVPLFLIVLLLIDATVAVPQEARAEMRDKANGVAPIDASPVQTKLYQYKRYSQIGKPYSKTKYHGKKKHTANCKSYHPATYCPPPTYCPPNHEKYLIEAATEDGDMQLYKKKKNCETHYYPPESKCETHYYPPETRCETPYHPPKYHKKYLISNRANEEIENQGDMQLYKKKKNTYRKTPYYPPETKCETPYYPPETKCETPYYPPETKCETPYYPPETKCETHPPKYHKKYLLSNRANVEIEDQDNLDWGQHDDTVNHRHRKGLVEYHTSCQTHEHRHMRGGKVMAEYKKKHENEYCETYHKKPEEHHKKKVHHSKPKVYDDYKYQRHY
jgi:hypothetical protein